MSCRPAHPALMDVLNKLVEPDVDAAVAAVVPANNDLGRQALAAAMQISLHKFRAMLAEHDPTDVEVDGMFALDALAAILFEDIGDAGAAKAKSVRTKGRQRWPEATTRLWGDDCAVLLRVLGKVLWADQVKANVEHAACPALPGQDPTKALAHLMSRNTEVVIVDQVPEIRLQQRVLARFPAGPELPADFAKQIPKIATLPAQKTLRYLVHRGWEQKFVELAPRPDVVEFVGGWRALGREAGIATGRQEHEARQAIEVLRHATVRIGARESCLLTYDFHGATAPGQQAHLIITLVGVLKPGSVHEVDKRDRANRQLVPLPTLLPPFVGRPADYAAQGLLQILVLAHLRAHAVDLVRTHSAPITAANWRTMADEACVPQSRLGAVVDAWLDGVGNTPAFLRRSQADRFTLAPAYQRELAVIVEGGQRSVEAQRRGRRRRRPHRDRGTNTLSISRRRFVD